MQRRGFLGAILGAAAAPAIVKAEILMPVRKLWVAPAVATLSLEEIVRLKALELKKDIEHSLFMMEPTQELADILYNISPADTPLLALVGKGKFPRYDWSGNAS